MDLNRYTKGILMVALTFLSALPSLTWAQGDHSASKVMGWVDFVQNRQQVLREVVSHEYVLKSYSKRTPQTYFEVVYKEAGTHYFFDTKIVSNDPKRSHPGSVETWNGERALRLRRETRILYLNNKPYDFTNEWRNLSGIWEPYKFTRKNLSTDRVASPRISDVLSFFTGASALGIKPDQEQVDGKRYFAIRTDAGVNLMNGLPEKTVAYFDDFRSGLPHFWTVSGAKDGVHSRHMIMKKAAAPMGKKSSKIDYAAIIESTYFDTQGKISNVVIHEFNDVKFNSLEIDEFDVDPSFADKIVDETQGGKLIVVPK